MTTFPHDDQHAAASLHILRRFLHERVSDQEAGSPQACKPRVAEERCEMCAAPLFSEHRHMLDLAHHRLLCACQACALLFSPQGANARTYLLIPQRYLALTDFQMSDEQWEELMLPVDMVYLLRSSESECAMAFYPSPAGATASQLEPATWQTLLAANPILNELEPDVEALLINRVDRARAYYLVPIDLCYRLVGLLRAKWSGLHGGTEVWEAIAAFFTELTNKAVSTSASNQQNGEQERSTSTSATQEGTERASTRPEF